MYSPSIRQSPLLRKKGDAGTRTDAAKAGYRSPRSANDTEVCPITM